jgi:hypothetical protein
MNRVRSMILGCGVVLVGLLVGVAAWWLIASLIGTGVTP